MTGCSRWLPPTPGACCDTPSLINLEQQHVVQWWIHTYKPGGQKSKSDLGLFVCCDDPLSSLLVTLVGLSLGLRLTNTEQVLTITLVNSDDISCVAAFN